MCTFPLILFLCIGILWGKISGSVIRNSGFINHGTEFSENIKDTKVKTTNKLTDTWFRKDPQAVESLPAPETRKQSQVLLQDDLNRKNVSKSNTSNRTSNNAKYSYTNKSLSRTLRPNGNSINDLITDLEIHADLGPNQTFSPIVEARFKENISYYETVGGKVYNAPIPRCSIFINLLVGNNITIQKFLLQPSENCTIGKPFDFNDASNNDKINNEMELSITNKTHISKSIDVINSTCNFSNGNVTFKHIPITEENIDVLNVQTPLTSSKSGLNPSSITENSVKTFQTTDADLTTGISFSSPYKQNQSSNASFNLEPCYYDDVDPSGIEIGWPITFFPPENCSETMVTNAHTNNCTVHELLPGSLTTFKAPYYDDVDPSGIEIGSPITFFPPENCNKTMVTDACFNPNFVKSFNNDIINLL